MFAMAPNQSLETNLSTKLGAVVLKAKRAIRRFNDDEQGMNTVEAIILLFVAAIVLLVFFALIWPLIRDSVMDQLNSLFDQTGQN
jgi:Flp pilus assembly pilin Flp